MLYAENFDMTNILYIFTPVDADAYEKLLIESKFDPEEQEFLVEGFREGFRLNYTGDRNVQLSAPNLRFDEFGSEKILWNKIMKEVQAKRFAGPFRRMPFDNYIQSPLGLVPKDGGKDTQLIFHLSYPRGTCKSVNANIPKEYCCAISRLH